MLRRIPAVVAAIAAMVAVTGAAAPTSAAPRDHVPDDQPLPGYTINNPPLPPLVVDGRPTKVSQGVVGHAAYTMEIPARWNGELMMWAHGFRGASRVLTVDPPGYELRRRAIEQGYAWAASSYYANDYHVRAGVLSTRRLADHFARTVRRPRRVYIAGVSMGGHVIGRSLEQYPRFYDGALPMCGVMGDQELFDYFLDFHVVSQALSGIREYPPSGDYTETVVPKIQEELGLTDLTPGGPDTVTPEGGQFRSIMINRSGGRRPADREAFAVWKDFLFGIVDLTGGDSLAESPDRVATNLRTRYRPNSPVDVNRTVQRVLPVDRVARLTRRLTEVPRIAGRPRVPVLSLHNLGDMFVPFSMEREYAADVDRHRRGRLLVQRAIRAAGHCEFSPAEAGRAWDDLTRWVGTRKRPAGDDVRRPSVIARRDYGCRFSDRNAYDNAPPGSSRLLYARCPAAR